MYQDMLDAQRFPHSCLIFVVPDIVAEWYIFLLFFTLCFDAFWKQETQGDIERGLEHIRGTTQSQ